MMIPEHIFKAYDIRALYPKEINETFAYTFGRAYAEFMKRDTGKENITLVVCQDMRDSSPSLKKEVIRGITDQGVDVCDIGLASTPTFYFGVSYYGFDGGVQITASHNPAGYNGLKMTRARAVAVSGDTGIKDIREIMKLGDFPESNKKGEVTQKEGVLEEQVAFAFSFAESDAIKPYNIVIDTGNGMGSLMMDQLFEKLPCSIDRMYWDLDGSFPNHESNPFKEKNNVDIQNRIKETNADLGIALDGDGDRIFFFDELGRMIEPAILRGILSQLFLRKNPGATIGYDIRPGKITEDMIVDAGGTPLVTKVGHSLIKEASIKAGAVFSGESSGHFFPLMPHGFFEEPVIIALMILQELSNSRVTASEYVKPFEKYIHSGEINFKVADKEQVFVRLKEVFSDNIQYELDGLSFAWEDYWFNVRASNTEPVVRLNLEGVNKQLVDEKVEEISQYIQ